jgi:hypothetical protein
VSNLLECPFEWAQGSIHLSLDTELFYEVDIVLERVNSQKCGLTSWLLVLIRDSPESQLNAIIVTNTYTTETTVQILVSGKLPSICLHEKQVSAAQFRPFRTQDAVSWLDFQEVASGAGEVAGDRKRSLRQQIFVVAWITRQYLGRDRKLPVASLKHTFPGEEAISIDLWVKRQSFNNNAGR